MFAQFKCICTNNKNNTTSKPYYTNNLTYDTMKIVLNMYFMLKNKHFIDLLLVAYV